MGPVPNVNGAPVLPSFSFTIGYIKSGLPHYFECRQACDTIFTHTDSVAGRLARVGFSSQSV